MIRTARGRVYRGVAGGRRIAVCSVAALTLSTFSVCSVPGDIALVTTATLPVALTDKQAPGSSPAAGVVMLFASSSPQQMSAGTAIVLTGDGIDLTNAHVVHGARQIIAHDPGAGRDWVVSAVAYTALHQRSPSAAHPHHHPARSRAGQCPGAAADRLLSPHADVPPSQPAISDPPQLLSAPRPLITALHRTELS